MDKSLKALAVVLLCCIHAFGELFNSLAMPLLAPQFPNSLARLESWPNVMAGEVAYNAAPCLSFSLSFSVAAKQNCDRNCLRNRTV